MHAWPHARFVHANGQIILLMFFSHLGHGRDALPGARAHRSRQVEESVKHALLSIQHPQHRQGIFGLVVQVKLAQLVPLSSQDGLDERHFGRVQTGKKVRLFLIGKAMVFPDEQLDPVLKKSP